MRIAAHTLLSVLLQQHPTMVAQGKKPPRQAHWRTPAGTHGEGKSGGGGGDLLAHRLRVRLGWFGWCRLALAKAGRARRHPAVPMPQGAFPSTFILNILSSF